MSDWRDLLVDELVKLERRARDEPTRFYFSDRQTGAARAAGLARLLKTFERRVMRVALGGTPDLGE